MLKWDKLNTRSFYMKKVLIFYASYGGGHLNAAKSIKECIDTNYPYYETE